MEELINKIDKELKNELVTKKYGKLKVQKANESQQKDGYDIAVKNNKDENVLLVDTTNQVFGTDYDEMPLTVSNSALVAIMHK